MRKKTNITTTSKELAGELNKSSTIWFTAIYTFLLCLIAGMLVFCYFSVFSSSFYLKSFKGKYLVGVVDASSYNQVKSGQLLSIEKYASINQIKTDDEIFYAGNTGAGSGVVQKLYITDGYMVISVNGQSKNIATSTIIGKIVNKTNFWGNILWFFQSWTGVITLNIVLVLMVVIRLIFGLTYEGTVKGRELKSRLHKQRQEYRQIKSIKSKYKNTGLDADTLEVLDGEYNQNKEMLISQAKGKDVGSAYKFLLQKVHRCYVTKQKLTFLDSVKITNCIELMCLVDKFDLDTEYMLTDLILRQKLIWFDKVSFIKSLNEYLGGDHTDEDLLCLMQVLYVLLKTNSNIKNAEIGGVIVKFIDDYSQKNAEKASTEVINLANSIKNLIKF